MGAHLEKLRDDLRADMSMIDEKIQALKAKTGGKVDEAERAIHQHLDLVQKKIDQGAAAVEAAKTKANEWAKTQNAEAKKKIAEWKAKGDAKSSAGACRSGRRLRQGHVGRRFVSSRQGREGRARSMARSLRH